MAEMSGWKQLRKHQPRVMLGLNLAQGMESVGKLLKLRPSPPGCLGAFDAFTCLTDECANVLTH
uniref:Uncharacterized protein n=1 Tax=Anopheles minimus TaxID=112268 RepID=A0A182VYP9_9DIPT